MPAGLNPSTSRFDTHVDNVVDFKVAVSLRGLTRELQLERRRVFLRWENIVLASAVDSHIIAVKYIDL